MLGWDAHTDTHVCQRTEKPVPGQQHTHSHARSALPSNNCPISLIANLVEQVACGSIAYHSLTANPLGFRFCSLEH